MHFNDQPFLVVTKNILNAILLIIPVFIVVIIITTILFLGILDMEQAEIALVPGSFLLSVVGIFYFNRYSILRFSFYNEYILIKYLVLPGRTFQIYYSDVKSIEWKVSYTFRSGQSEYLMVIHSKSELLDKTSSPTSLGLKYMTRENWPEKLRAEYCPVLDAYDIVKLRKNLNEKFPFHLDNINGLDLKKIERIENR